jgi:hypothetical protein
MITTLLLIKGENKMANLKNVNLMSQDTFNNIEQVDDELYAVSASGIGFPSSRHEDLTLGASGTTYKAPANGYAYVNKESTASGQYVNIYDGTVASHRNISSASGQPILVLAPVLKGKNFKVEYTAAGTTKQFRFIYAEGE